MLTQPEKPTKQEALSPLHFVLKGDARKPPLILLHGWGRDHRVLAPLGELLTSHYRVILVDLPGFGRSRRPDSVWSTVDYAERIVQLMSEMGIERCTLAGHSFGGRVSIRLAARHPERVERLVLMASHGIPTPRPLRKRIRLQLIAIARRIVKTIDSVLGTSVFRDRFVPLFASSDYLRAGEMRAIFVKTVNEDARADAQLIQAPTLLLWGADDTETPVALGARLHELIPQSKFYVYPLHGHDIFENAGHHLMARTILAFGENRDV